MLKIKLSLFEIVTGISSLRKVQVAEFLVLLIYLAKPAINI